MMLPQRFAFAPDRPALTGWFRLLPAILLVALALPALASDNPPVNANRPLPAIRLPEGVKPPDIDGDLTDPVWQRAAKAVTFFDPQSGKPVEDQTEAYLIYDATSIYIGFYCHDSHPDQIVARETVRDAQMFNDDYVRVDLDPFHTSKREDYAIFYVNPLGTRRTELGGGRAGKVEWQGDWDAATKRVNDGWTVEMRIPWSILSYPRTGGKQTMGLNFRRGHVRTRVEGHWSDLGPQDFHERDGLWQGVEPPAQKWKPRLSLLPYLLPVGQAGGDHSQFHSGLDVRYQPTPELTGVATLNPDFASVEGAVESIGFSRSERFVPDKRPFFEEGRDYLGFGEDYSIGPYFNSGRIKHVDTGVKLYGKINDKTTVGLLSTIGLGRENNFAARFRRELSPTSQLNLLVTQRIAPGQDNTTVAFGPNYRRGKWSLNGEAAHTLGPGAGGTAWTGAINLEDKNLFTTLRYRRVGTTFLDRLGYVPFVDYQGWSSFTDWNVEWRHGALRFFEMSFSPQVDWHINGKAFRRYVDWGVNLDTRSDYHFEAGVSGGAFDNTTDLLYRFGFGANVSNRYRSWAIFLTTGKQADKPYTSFGPSLNVRLLRKLDVSVGSFVQAYQGSSQQHIVTFNYQITPFRAWGGRIVLENSHTNLYLSYRNSGHRGTDTYFIFGDPNAVRFTRRMMLKFVFAI